MDDLDGVLKESKDDEEMQRMAVEEQQELQQQVLSPRLPRSDALPGEHMSMMQIGSFSP